jgi:hypothetical protein
MNRQWVKRIAIAAFVVLGFSLLEHQLKADKGPAPAIASNLAKEDGASAALLDTPQPTKIPKDWIFWSDDAEGFGASFPGQPDRVGMTTASEAGYGYIFVRKDQDYGGSTYTIMVTPLPSNLTAALHDKYLEARNAQYVQMAIDPATAQKSWTQYGGNRKRLNYKFKYAQDGMTLTAQGFWIIDRGRSIKVGVAYTDNLPAKQVADVLAFPDTFFLTKIN